MQVHVRPPSHGGMSQVLSVEVSETTVGLSVLVNTRSRWCVHHRFGGDPSLASRPDGSVPVHQRFAVAQGGVDLDDAADVTSIVVVAESEEDAKLLDLGGPVFVSQDKDQIEWLLARPAPSGAVKAVWRADMAGATSTAVASVVPSLPETAQRLPAVYLTNALGELTGYGTVTVSHSDVRKVPFESGPGVLLNYLAEIDGEKFLLANLEVCFQCSFWGLDENPALVTLDEAVSFVERCRAALATRCTPSMRVLPLCDRPGGFVVGLAVPLHEIHDRAHAMRLLAGMFAGYV